MIHHTTRLTEMQMNRKYKLRTESISRIRVMEIIATHSVGVDHRRAKEGEEKGVWNKLDSGYGVLTLADVISATRHMGLSDELCVVPFELHQLDPH